MRHLSRLLSILLAFMLAFTPMAQAAQISRQHADTIVNGNLANANDVSDELNSLVNESNSQDTRLTNIESGNSSFSGIKTFSSAPIIPSIKESVAGYGVNVSGTRIYNGFANLSSIRGTFASVDISTNVVTFTGGHGLSTGVVVKVLADKGAVLDTGLTDTASYFFRSLTTDTGTFHTTSADASAGTNAVDITAVGSGTRYLIGAPSSLREGDVWVDGGGLKFRAGGSTIDVASVLGTPFPVRFRASRPPVYLSTTTFSVTGIIERDLGNTINIYSPNLATTVDIATTGLNGIAQSANLTGTVSVTASSTTVTFSSSQTSNLSVGDVITTAGGQARRLVSGSGTAWVAESAFSSTETAVTVKRGGRAPNTWYYLYSTCLPDGSGVGLILSTRNLAASQTVVDPPSGYSFSIIRQFPFAIRLDSSREIMPFSVAEGWPYQPLILFRDDTPTVLSSGTATSATTLNCFMPPISRSAFLEFLSVYVSTSSTAYVRTTGTTGAIQVGGAETSGRRNLATSFIATNASQQIDYYWNAATNQLSILQLGFVVTEVP